MGERHENSRKDGVARTGTHGFGVTETKERTMSDTIEPIDARQARCLTVKRAIAISYGTDRRYEELVYDREPCRRRAQYCTDYERFIFDRDFRYRNGTNYLDALLGRFNWEGVRNAGFDPDAEPKVYAIPDDMPLYRWVLKDGTVVTTTTGFPQGDAAVLRTLDGRNMFVPLANVDYITELEG